MNDIRMIAYFSMEVGLDPNIPTYSGGLGILAGDTIRSAADLAVPMVAVSLLHRKGYFRQRLDPDGTQHEEPVHWSVEDYLQEMPQRASVAIEGRNVQLRCWKYEVAGVGGFVVPVYLLDSDLPENSDFDRTLTHFLYGGDKYYRLCQEMILGIGGVHALRALGYDQLKRFHMNEGHAALLSFALLEEAIRKSGRSSLSQEDIQEVREQCVFTTHTPVPAGHDQFRLELALRVFGPRQGLLNLKDAFSADLISRMVQFPERRPDLKSLTETGSNLVNMTYLALNMSRYVNGVAKKHGEVSRLMFGGYEIDAITNGVHAVTWTAPPFQRLYDRHIPGWRADNFSLRGALSIPQQEVWDAHSIAKRQLIEYVNRETNAGLAVHHLTLGFARRAATYKRADLLLTDLDRLRNIARQVGPLQIVYAGKAHPQDAGGKELIRRIHHAKGALLPEVSLVYLENYDMELAKLITSGVDVWLNTPEPPLEASGTSGMKAALNGIPSLSVLDGWWIEGHIEGVTGWSIGDARRRTDESASRSQDASSLYGKLELLIAPMFYGQRERFLDIMLHAIAINGSFFNTQRMVQQYAMNAYFR